MKKEIDLKKVLMEMGNKLATEHHFEPGEQPFQSIGRGCNVTLYDENERRTAIIILFTKFINEHPEARQVLNELGFNWSMADDTLLKQIIRD